MREFLVTSTNRLGISLAEQQTGQFLAYQSQLLTWNKTINLTSITDPFEIISKHFVDSLTALSAFKFPSQSIVIDVGSGAGLPGIPLKIVHSDLRLVLVEPSHKKCSFLHSVVGTLMLEHVCIYSGELKHYAAQEPCPLADVILLRALRFDEIAESAARILKPTGHVLLYRTEKVDEWFSRDFRVESNHGFTLPMNHGHRVVTVLRKTTAV
ncbi:MAG TPA: 16S rRNA (guanine(527)-N(7))-methyltransferase RsmG [Nitrospira sp.]